MGIIDKINEVNKDELINKLDFINYKKVDNGLSESYNISIPFNHTSSFGGLDIESNAISIVLNEINSSFYNRLIKNIFDSDIYEVIDFRGKDLDTDFSELIPRIKNYSNGYKNIVCSSFIASLFQDSSIFSVHTTSNKINYSSYIHKIGNFSDLTIWVDPYMKYNDTRLACFNDFDIDIKKVSFQQVVDNLTLSPKVISKFDYSFMHNGSKVIYLISEHTDSEVFSAYKKIDRDLKIDKILGDE